MVTFDEAWQIADGIEGWLLKEQGRALFEAAHSLAPGTRAVEIGSHRGKSATLIALGLPPAARLTAVDPFDDPRWGGGPESLAAFNANLTAAGVNERVDLFKGLSEEASATWSEEPVGFLWVDGAHDVTSTLKDFDGWLPHLARGARLYVHDAFSAVGTTHAIFRRFFFARNVRFVGSVRSLAMFEVGPVSIVGRTRSALTLIARLGFFARMIAIKLARRSGHPRLERRLMTTDNEPLI
ncbi:MAG: class I SAM-dependent methyltransferase [Acidobacteria bacterium]|nr:class I SAM-dependent methyltransferase [Acidobacteriota bacterium]